MESFFEIFVRWVNVPLVHVGGSPVTFGGMGSAVLVFIGVLIISSFVQRLLSRHLSKKFSIPDDMLYALRRILHYFFIIAGVVLAAQCVGLNFGTIAVALGFLGVGVGLGLQNLTANFVSGLIILLERPIRVGDLVKIQDSITEVISINMRSTVVRTGDNVTIIAPNTKFVENEVVNWSIDDPKVRVHCPVGVAYGSDVQLVKKVLLDIAHQHGEVMKSPEPIVRFLAFGDSSLNFDLLVWCGRPDNQAALKSDLNFMIDKSFKEFGIQMPFPQRDIHLQMTPALEKLAKG